MQDVEDVHLQLVLVMEDGVVVFLERDIGELAEEVRIVDEFRHHLHVFLEPAGDRAGLGRQFGIQEVEAALERPLHECASVHAGTSRHVIGRHIRRCTSRRTQPYGEAAGEVQQDFRHEVARITERVFSLVFGLTNQIVVGLEQKIFELDHIFQISHMY